MIEMDESEPGSVLTKLILSMFKVNGLVLTWGDRMVTPLGLTSVRWQLLGAIVLSESPQPVAWLARDLGANRQNVQRVVNDLYKEGMVILEPNPHHRRAKLVVLTEKGQQTYYTIFEIYSPKINALAEGVSISDINTANRVMISLRRKLEKENDIKNPW